MTTVRTRNSVYHLDGDKVMLESGTPSNHLPFGLWVQVAHYGSLQVGERLRINYLDGKTRFTSSITSIEEADVGNHNPS